MNWQLEEAAKHIVSAIETLQADALEEAKENLLQDSKATAAHLFDASDGWTISVAGLDWKIEDGDEALTVYIQDLEGDGLLHKFDPIGWLIEGHTPWADKEGGGMELDISFPLPIQPQERHDIDRAIAALQAGIDRLKAYEAERLKAQS